MTDAPAFDKSVLRQLVSELGAEDTAEVLTAFVEDTQRKVDLMLADAANAALIRQEAHGIKSSAATFGFARLSALALELEQGAAVVASDQLRHATGLLGQEFQRTSHYVRSVLLPSNLEIA
ncbi:histidine kinase [Bradyrhizobium guangdongense]|uniref:Hpt domain-containing protein n=1 Tax=Bradyrhizobium guangdongense TaxID=1325090 RepID=UPI00112A3A8F|nr:Hpt domain-containing protein [Bradyrhizobium guangdongense]TPQ39625.1 histidine kinase [Bradyrhizobium guangdongense]